MSRYDNNNDHRTGGSRYRDNQRRDRDRERERERSRDRGRAPERNSGGAPKKKGSAVGTLFSTLLLIVALGVFGYSAFTLYGYYKEYKAGTDEYGDLNDKYVNIISTPAADPSISAETEAPAGPAVLTNVEELENPDTLETKLENALMEDAEENGQIQTLPTLKNPINFAELKAINEDIMGWIRIGALDISYPIAQAADNDYYLHRTFERVENFAGCIFLNCDNTKYMTDQNTIIYGHNMKNGSMFGTLHEFAKQETYDKNPYFWIFTPDFIYQYRIFSCSQVHKIGDPYRTRFITEDFQNFINNSQSTSMLDNHGVEVTTDDRIVTLSTCTSDDSTRLIVQGKLEKVYVAK